MKPFSGLVVDLLNLQSQKEGDAIIINHVLLKKPALHAPPRSRLRQSHKTENEAGQKFSILNVNVLLVGE